MNKKKILIIGGGGYIGTELSKALEDGGFEVCTFDTFQYSNYMDNISTKAIKDDIKNVSLYQSTLRYFDIILYLASPRLVHIGNINQVNHNLNILSNFLDYIGDEQKLYFFSSCSVYGNTDEYVDESCEVYETSLYSKLKIESEKIIEQKCNNYTILRLSTLFGHSDVNRNDILINNLIKDAFSIEQIEIFDGESYRPNIYLKDLINVLIKIIKYNITEPIINVGHESLNITKNNIVQIIKSIYKNEINVINIESNDTRSYRVNFDLLNSYIHHNFLSYETTIKEYYEFCN